MNGIWALGAYLAVILLWTTLIKRSVGEAMILGFLAVLPFTGAAAAQVGWSSLYSAATDEIVYATMAFVFTVKQAGRTIARRTDKIQRASQTIGHEPVIELDAVTAGYIEAIGD